MEATRQGTGDVALALSGGGIRAMAFHMGMLKYFAEQGCFERVQRISTVSGGSLLIGLVMKESGLRWPTSKQFLERVYPSLQNKLCSRSLQWGAFRQFRPWKPQYIVYRAHLLSLALQREWDVTARLRDLPLEPEWSINGTTAENGKRLRFKADSLGDYDLGYVDDVQDYPLANAMAVSAAFPGGFGPLEIDPHRFTWRKRAWDAPPEAAQELRVSFKSLHLYDGGVYDNLGLEPFFDAGKLTPKHEARIIVSDAGSPLRQGFSLWAMNPLRFKRVADIMSEQARALRVRTFMRYLHLRPQAGAYVYIGMPASAEHMVDGLPPSQFRTTLRCTTPTAFEAIARHGYHVALTELTSRGWLSRAVTAA
jgi:NTE family protein